MITMIIVITMIKIIIIVIMFMIMMIFEIILIVFLLISADLDPVDRVFLPVLHLPTMILVKIWQQNMQR